MRGVLDVQQRLVIPTKKPAVSGAGPFTAGGILRTGVTGDPA
jgi:hypothetical protein